MFVCTFVQHEHDRRLQTPEPELIPEQVWRWENGEKVPYNAYPGETIAPLWQIAPAAAPAVNVNLLSHPTIAESFDVMVKRGGEVMTTAVEVDQMFDFAFDDYEKYRKKEPHMFLLQPVFSSFADDKELVAVIVALTSVGNLLDRILPQGANGIHAVLKDTCGKVLTFEVNGAKANFVGFEDFHEPKWNHKERASTMEQYEEVFDGLCEHTLYIYPSQKFRDTYDTNKPVVYTIIVVIAFVVTTVLLLIYDFTVSRRQEKTMRTALRSNAVVSNLFPEAVRDRVLKDVHKEPTKDKKGNTEAYLAAGEVNDHPIADFYPAVTILFADIAGFTAWSSTREPFQVFLLLENLYADFDKIAKRRGIFKVEVRRRTTI